MKNLHRTAIASTSHDAKNLINQAIGQIRALEQSISQSLIPSVDRGEFVSAVALNSLLSQLQESRIAVESASEKIAHALQLYVRGSKDHFYSSVDIYPFVLEAMTNVEEAANRKGLSLLMDVGGEQGLLREEWILARDSVSDALGNALQNAVRYAATTVLLRVVDGPSSLRIEVHDDGQGYPEAVLKGRYEDGAGLLITKELMRETGGKLSLSNESNLGQDSSSAKGAKFCMEIPAHVD